MNESRTPIQSSFGWDLAAYGEDSDSALCFAKCNGRDIDATILQYERICKPKLEMVKRLNDVVKAEAEFVNFCCDIASLYIDVPIDLQGLPRMVNRCESGERAVYAWQLYRRPIDQMLTAISPLAAHLGYPVARLANVLRELGKRPSKLFETYPAASLRSLEYSGIEPVTDKYRWLSHLKRTHVKNWSKELSSLFYTPGETAKMKFAKPEDLDRIRDYFLYGGKAKPSFAKAVDEAFNAERDLLKNKFDKPPYKSGRARWNGDDQKWETRPTSDNAQKARNQCLADLANALGFRATDSIDEFTADEFDAILCACAGCLPDEYRMPEEELRRMVQCHLIAKESLDGVKDSFVPAGYHILKGWPKKMQVHVTKSSVIQNLNELKKHL